MRRERGIKCACITRWSEGERSEDEDEGASEQELKRNYRMPGPCYSTQFAKARSCHAEILR